MFLGVAFGAFGAHALNLSPDRRLIYGTGVEYHLAHALALLVVGVLEKIFPQGKWNLSGWLFSFGILMFSGSLYVLAATGEGRWGVVTPLGGVCFLAGWVCFALSASRGKGFEQMRIKASNHG